MATTEQPDTVSAVVRAVVTGQSLREPGTVLSRPELGQIQHRLRQIRDQQEIRLRNVTESVPENIDDWIAAAARLDSNVTVSRLESKQISDAADRIVALESDVEAAVKMTAQAMSELELASSLVSMLEVVNQMVKSVEMTRQKLDSWPQVPESLVQAASRLATLDRELVGLGPLRLAKFAGIVDGLVGEVRREVEKIVRACWIGAFFVPIGADRGGEAISGVLDRISLEAASELGVRDVWEAELIEQVGEKIVVPLFGTDSAGPTAAFSIDSPDSPFSIETAVKVDLTTGIDTLDRVVRYVRSKYSNPIRDLVLDRIVTSASPLLIKHFFLPLIPIELSGYGNLHAILVRLDRFLADQKNNDDGAFRFGELQEWQKTVGLVWLSSRKAAALDSVRAMYASGRLSCRRSVSVDSDPASKDVSEARDGPKPETDEDDGSDAWGFDNDNEAPEREPGQEGEPGQEDDAWGWDQDPDVSRVAGKNKSSSTTDYVISEVPEHVLLIITRTIDDSIEINKSADAYPVIRQSGPRMAAILTDVLTMYRATAMANYRVIQGGDLLLHNDCLWLSRQLARLTVEHKDKADSPPFNLLLPRLSKAIPELDNFGRLGREVEICRHKTMIRSFFSRSNPISSLSSGPKQDEGVDLIKQAVGMISDAAGSWESVLPLGSAQLAVAVSELLSFVIDHVVDSILQMESISAVASEGLFAICQQVKTAESTLSVEISIQDSEEVADLGAITANWVRIQYMTLMMEGRLVDVEKWWQDGDLSVAFTVEQTVGLIVALFEESSDRSRTVNVVLMTPPKR